MRISDWSSDVCSSVLDDGDERTNRAVIDRDLVGEEGAIGAPVARVARACIRGHGRDRRVPVKETVARGRSLGHQNLNPASTEIFRVGSRQKSHRQTPATGAGRRTALPGRSWWVKFLP